MTRRTVSNTSIAISAGEHRCSHTVKYRIALRANNVRPYVQTIYNGGVRALSHLRYAKISRRVPHDRKTPRKGLLFIVTLVRRRCDKIRRYPLRADRARKGGLPRPARQMLTMFLRYSAALPCPQIPFLRASGGADDILDRDQTLSPDTVDQTVYPLEFEHATPTSGTLTSLSAAGSVPSPVSRVFTTWT